MNFNTTAHVAKSTSVTMLTFLDLIVKMKRGKHSCEKDFFFGYLESAFAYFSSANDDE